MHMRDACLSASRFVAARQRGDLDRDEMLLFALVRAIEIMGEAAGKVSAETQAACPQLPWREVVGIRNRLVHAYFDIDKDILWNTTQQDIPYLLTVVETLLQATD
ncbi:MAG: DUF86 domain-containing protein [Hydrogenophaga sp.]|nr:DUF86 domain-containing protein [Hydrogenophaga sp.]